jgi:hypothetical protein
VRTCIVVDNKAVEPDPKTAAGRRSVPLDAWLVTEFRAHRRRQLEERLGAGEAWKESRFEESGHLPAKALVGEARRSRKVRDSRPTPLTPRAEKDRAPSQIDEDAKAMIAACMSHKRGSYEAFEALVDQVKAEPEEYTTSLVCLAIEMLNRLSNLDPQHRSPELLVEEIGPNLAH